MGENFRRKARLVAGGHTTATPNTLTYYSIVSRDSMRIAFTIAALYNLSVLACDIQNVYRTAPYREKIFTIAGPEFGSQAGNIYLSLLGYYMTSKLLIPHFVHFQQNICMTLVSRPLKLIQML